MATKKGKSTPPDTKVRKLLAKVSSKLRAHYAWFNDLADGALFASLLVKRKESRKEGPKLSNSRRSLVIRQLERIQGEIELLQRREGRLKNRLIADWGHSGVDEILDDAGGTLIVPSASYAIDEVSLKPLLTIEQWREFTEERLVVEKVLAAAEQDLPLRKIIQPTIRVTKLQVAVRTPSSRGKEGKSLDDE